jgi:hypothetical protein
VTDVRKPEVNGAVSGVVLELVDGSTLGWEFPPQSAIEGALPVNRLQALIAVGK